ncbi:hypothetical protein [Thermococcus gammatolerans]|uniref:Uncharacterized protein n=1 Tax=Thermococcus gammatolerans (strain DSM 15229 / JCM 11827 / EJ3) TaxID=593117 RepID=C5A2N0_THEGJ|nr:hypothetical protein [Thermococcus gammatolerans]ACS32532.1 Conserved hypothetical protein [Thermococcus gammatolerans EJ3]
MKMRVVFDKEYDVLTGVYRVRVRELEFDEELEKVLSGIDPSIKLGEEEIKLSELRDKVFELRSREEAEKIMSEIRGALIETLSSLIARFKEAQSFNGSVVYEIDFNELFKE